MRVRQQDLEDQQERRPRSFSKAALQESKTVLERLAEVISERPVVQGFTIDGPTSKDLDDALWLERRPDGGYQLDISIADVGSLLTPELTPTLDKEALQRSFTRYFAEDNAPMLPRSLSEASLSLLEGQPRPTLTLTLPFDAKLRMGEPSIRHTTLTSIKRFTYESADHAIEHPHNELTEMVRDAYGLAQRFFQKRRARGALALYDLQAGWATNEEGNLVSLSQGERHKAHILIQEYMILANQVFAHFLADKGVLALYRNHVAKAIAPERAKLLEMLETAVSHPEEITPERIQATVNLVMERAQYAPTIAGHFALNLPAYTHMTSPLRRYPDLVNQRILSAILKGEKLPYTKAVLEAIAEHVNAVEKRNKEAKQAHFLAVYDNQLRQMIEEAKKEQNPRPLEQLDARHFHSMLRMAAETHVLQPELEQELLTRLSEDRVQAHDLFTLVFRYPQKGEVWERVKRDLLTWLQEHPHHAVSMLMMGKQSFGWSEPDWRISPIWSGMQQTFQAQAWVLVDGKVYSSSVRHAPQKDRAKQLASAELLAQIAGVPLALPDSQDNASQVTDASDLSEDEPPDLTVSINAKGELQHIAQVNRWKYPDYRIISRTGSSHTPAFTVEAVIKVNGQPYTAQGRGRTKVQAEQAAAYRLLQLLPEITAKQAEQPTNNQAVTTLHQMAQRNEIRSATFTYEQEGQPHAPKFTCLCIVTTLDGKTIEGHGTETTKKAAAQIAAAQALAALQNTLDEVS